ncbi:MAG: ArgK/MeaB family GTPase [Microthrixaceae bacterium]
MGRPDQDPSSLVEQALERDKLAVARLISLFEDRRPDAATRRAAVIDALDSHPDRADGTIVGITGTPGSGKSSLLSRLTVDLLAADARLSIAVVAVDPSSHVSGGALLGDRTRMRYLPDERRLFFRSQASDSDLGGLGPSSFQVCRLLTRLFDCVMIETVGIGQSEADIRHLADRVYLVLQPLGGDEVQFLKAGIIEVPHAFVLNKSDEPSASTSFHHLRSSMWLARPFDEEEPPIFRTSARTGEGLEELEADIRARITATGGGGLAAREPYFLERWVDDEWGRHGRRFLVEQCGGAAAYLDASGGYDAAQASFGDELLAALRG